MTNTFKAPTYFLLFGIPKDGDKFEYIDGHKYSAWLYNRMKEQGLKSMYRMMHVSGCDNSRGCITAILKELNGVLKGA